MKVKLGRRMLKVTEFPYWIGRHRREYPDTKIIEKEVSWIVQEGFPKEEAYRLIRLVCRWGGYYGIAARVISANKPAVVSGVLKQAHEKLNDGCAEDALRRVNGLVGLGRPSYASKILRFIAPRDAAVLDQAIGSKLGFSMNPAGYGELLEGCRTVVSDLKASSVSNPIRPRGVWYVCDVEAAFFAKVQGL
jgi:hypothetical protein